MSMKFKEAVKVYAVGLHVDAILAESVDTLSLNQ